MQQQLLTNNVDVSVKVVCGSTHSLVLTSEGKIYSWGSNDKGQLGHGKKSNLEKEPIMVIRSIYLIMIKKMKNRKKIKYYMLLVGCAYNGKGIQYCRSR